MTGTREDVTMEPVALAEGFGLLHRSPSCASADVGVVLCSAWGIHELSSRKMMFQLASRLAAEGLPTIRFDYPGTADAIGSPAEGFETWIERASGAADRLKAACGLTRIVFAGLGIGGTVAMLAAGRRDDVAALALMAPVVGGRRYLREIALGASMVEQALGLDAIQRSAGVSIGGIVMPPAVARDLKSIDLMTADAGTPRPALVVGRASQPQEAALADHLQALGWPVERAEFDGYDQAMDNPTISAIPTAVVEAVTLWCSGLVSGRGGAAGIVPAANPVLVESGGLKEEPLTFAGGLFGVLTHPGRRVAASTVVFLNSGYDHHAGWAYQWVRTARALAASGIASLRFDTGNIGDSAPRAGAPEQVLYSKRQQDDIVAAIDMLAGRGVTPVILVGRCSGAFAALHATACDERVAAAVLINPLRLIWDPDEEVEVAIRGGPRSMADYRHRALSGKTFRRLLKGDIHLRGVAKGIGTQVVWRLGQSIAPLMGSLSKTTRLRRQGHALMEKLSQRGTAIRFVCSAFDASLDQLAFYFGGNYGGLTRFEGASLTTIPDADHNMTPEPAHQRVVEAIREIALDLSAASTDRVQPAAQDAAAPRPSVAEEPVRA